jgi:hypothetical protein
MATVAFLTGAGVTQSISVALARIVLMVLRLVRRRKA